MEIEQDDMESIERVPQDDWVTESSDENGETVYYLTVHITGLHSRGFGPFDSREGALSCLDHLLNGVKEGIEDAMDNDEEFTSGRAHCIIESQSALQYLGERYARDIVRR